MNAMTDLPARIPDSRPLRFEAWPDDIKTRAFELWATVALGSAPRVEHLLAQEGGDSVATPAASTIRTWAAEGDWAGQRDAHQAQTAGRTLRQLQATTLQAIALAQATLIDAMLGMLDSQPYGGAARVRAAEAMLRLAERSGVRFVVTEAELQPPADADDKGLSLDQRARRARAMMAEANRSR